MLSLKIVLNLVMTLILIIVLILVKNLLFYVEGFSNKAYNQSGWSIMPPSTWELPQKKLPVCVGKQNIMEDRGTIGYPDGNMVWHKNLEVVQNAYIKDERQYAPGIFVMDELPKYPKFRGNI